jgi:hypothetical protein
LVVALYAPTGEDVPDEHVACRRERAVRFVQALQVSSVNTSITICVFELME